MSSLATDLDPDSLWMRHAFDAKSKYSNGSLSFLENLLPQTAIAMPVFEVLSIIDSRYGQDALRFCLNPENTQDSPLDKESNPEWLKSSRMLGVNIRTIGNFFNLLKYLLTVGDSFDSVHILPIWEPGVVGSLYGKISWNINPEFFSQELAQAIPHLDTVEKQLKVLMNIMHLMGKRVGLDVIPHTDRFAEIVFLYPQMFEWIQRKGSEFISLNGANKKHVQNSIWNYLENHGTADGSALNYSKELFFDYSSHFLTDQQKLSVLFGPKNAYQLRLERRIELMLSILHAGYETLPVTMAPPYRGLRIDSNDYIKDDLGNIWYNYHFSKPEKMSRVFGPLTRYKTYDTHEDQSLNFSKVEKSSWDYISERYLDCCKTYNFDFMRGDMAHVQPRSNGVPKELDLYYDPLRYVKKIIQEKHKPYFAFYAETFLAPANTMGYGIEEDHLEAIEAEATLGDLQSEIVDSPSFLELFNRYYMLRKSRSFAPSFTLITADKDDPRFDKFYKDGNLLRYFIGLFFKDLPSYISMGFECRNPHISRGKNEEYSKLYVFQINDDLEADKVTHGPYIWGSNHAQFFEFQKLKIWFEQNHADWVQSEIADLHLPSFTEPYLQWKCNRFTFRASFSKENKFQPLSGSLIYSSEEFSVSHLCEIWA
jgi:hypothetical protein